MKISSSISSPINMSAIQVKRSAALQTPAIPVSGHASLKTNPRPILEAYVASFGSPTGSQRRNPGISTVSRVDMAKLIGHSSSETLLYLVDYDPATYTGKTKDGNLFSDHATSLASGEEKFSQQFNPGSALREAAFNNFVKHLPNTYLNIERFGLQFDKSKDLRTDLLDFDRFQDQLQEVFRLSTKEQAEKFSKEISKTQERIEYSPGKKYALPVDDKVPVLSNSLSDEEEAMLRELEARDIAVRAHEMAHMAAGAGLTSGASFTFQRGPNGRQYAIGGEVQIDMSSGSTPEDTLNRAKRILSAASAPTDPSAADAAVAMQAAQMLQAAQVEIAQVKQEQTRTPAPESENSISERLSANLPSAPPSKDPFTGKIEEQPYVMQEQSARSSGQLLSAERTIDGESHLQSFDTEDRLVIPTEAEAKTKTTSPLEDVQTPPTLDELLESPKLLDNVLRRTEYKNDTSAISLIKNLSVDVNSLSNLSTQTGAISASFIPSKIDQPTISNSPQERSLEEVTSSFSSLPVETETTQAVKQPSLLDLLE